MIELRYFEKEDMKQLMSWIDSAEFLLQWSGPAFEYPLTEQQLEQYIENANQKHSDRLAFKVIDKGSRQVIGHISLGNIDEKNKSARVGKVLIGEKIGRGKGIGQRMINEVLKIGFDELHLHRISLGVFDFNLGAIACYEKAGFKKEGYLRDYRKMGDQYWSLWEMSILESEWQEIKNK